MADVDFLVHQRLSSRCSLLSTRPPCAGATIKKAVFSLWNRAHNTSHAAEVVVFGLYIIQFQLDLVYQPFNRRLLPFGTGTCQNTKNGQTQVPMRSTDMYLDCYPGMRGQVIELHLSK